MYVQKPCKSTSFPAFCAPQILQHGVVQECARGMSDSLLRNSKKDEDHLDEYATAWLLFDTHAVSCRKLYSRDSSGSFHRTSRQNSASRSPSACAEKEERPVSPRSAQSAAPLSLWVLSVLFRIGASPDEASGSRRVTLKYQSWCRTSDCTQQPLEAPHYLRLECTSYVASQDFGTR